MKTIIAFDGTELLVSDCDYSFLSKYSWSKDSCGYYKCTNRGTWNGHEIHNKLIHWFIAQLMNLDIPESFTIDHIDRNKLNNLRSNLRVASKILQNHNRGMMKSNTSGYTGVTFNRQCKLKPWQTSICMPNGKRKYLGIFKTPEEASKVYQVAKKRRNDKEIKRCLKIQEEAISENNAAL